MVQSHLVTPLSFTVFLKLLNWNLATSKQSVGQYKTQFSISKGNLITCTWHGKGIAFLMGMISAARLEHVRELLALPGMMGLSPCRRTGDLDLTCRRLHSVEHTQWYNWFRRNFGVRPNNCCYFFFKSLFLCRKLSEGQKGLLHPAFPLCPQQQWCLW